MIFSLLFHEQICLGFYRTYIKSYSAIKSYLVHITNFLSKENHAFQRVSHPENKFKCQYSNEIKIHFLDLNCCCPRHSE